MSNMPEEGWLRCADCHARVYGEIYEELLKIKSPKGRVELKERLKAYEDDVKLRLGRAKRGQEFIRPSEDTCIFCHYEAEFKDEFEKGNIQVIETFNKFCKRIKKKYI